MKITCVCPFVCAAAVMLCSCGAKSADPDRPLPENFSVTAEMTDGDFACTAEMTRSANGWDIVMTAPETVEGVSFHITGENMTIRSGELSFTTPHEDILQASPVRLTAAVLDRCVKHRTEGELYGQHYAAELDGGQPVQLVAGTDFSVTFCDFSEENDYDT